MTPVCPSIHPSVCPHLGGTPARSRWRGGGGTIARSSQGGVPHLRSPCQTWPGGTPTGGYPSQVQLGDTPAGGYPHLSYPHGTWLGGIPTGGYPAGGYSTLGTPCQTWWGTLMGVPHLRYPHQTWPEGYPNGGTSARSSWGVPCWGGTPPRVPPSDLARWYPAGGTPPWVPPSDLVGGTPMGVPQQGNTPPQVPPMGQPGGTHWGVPPSDLAGGIPPRVTDGVLDTPRSVCLLRSRRRTFLLHCYFCYPKSCLQRVCLN